MRPLLITICCGMVLATHTSAQSEKSGPNPFDTAEGAAAGGALFQTHCTYCHGANGEGGRGADLTSGVYRRGGSDANLYTTIRNGIPGTEMPSVRVSEDDVWKLVAFVKKLGASTVGGEKAAGDVAAGKAVFEGKGRCLGCHAAGHGEGGSVGPDLNGVGRRRSLEYLKESLLKPDADVQVAFRTFQIDMKSGQTVMGVRLNEDDVSIQLRDASGNLRSFLKDGIKEIHRDRPSLMPAYGSRLDNKEIEDVVAYLSSLRGAQ
jgi:putative heme-binding domain-containing protein